MDFLKDYINIVFVEPESPGNIGFLARTMKNFGLYNLILVNPCELEKEAYFQAMHAKEIVSHAKLYDSLAELLETEPMDFIIGTSGTPGGSYKLSRIPLKPHQLAESINSTGKIAILFGREGNGLYNNEIELCDALVSIPTDKKYPIMNITHAAAIVFYELFKNKNEFQVQGLEEASLSEKQRLIDEMEEMIKKINIPEHKEKNGAKTFKNIIGRAFITGREAHTLKGILRRINRKI
ncbi:MAG: TrmJ/YjtD family RNA methyltransferase [Methanobacteriaceae archaeon]|nr:TrmJ/YjtD family RNA methyltransferase [Methanobacteriaceae archaeon]